MMEWLKESNSALWFLLGLALLGGELALPGIFLLWFGTGALATALLLALLLPFLPWQGQILLFLFCSVLGVVLSRYYCQKKQPRDMPFLNEKIAELTGRSFRLEAAISGHKGRLLIDDTLWPVHGEDSPEGSFVRITGYQAGMLEVEPVSPPIIPPQNPPENKSSATE